MRWLHKLKKPHSILLTGILTSALLPSALWAGSPAYAVDNGCLAMVGTGNVPVTSIERNQMVTVNYTLDPSGTHTVTQSREAIDVAFVADVSGSMDYHMNKNDSRTPIRLSILKEASKTLTDKFKSVNMSDRLGLIKFSTTATKVLDLTTKYDDVQTAINKLDADGSTNIDDGLVAAKNMLTASGTKPIKQVILLTDGKATVWTDESDHNKQKSGETSAANAARADAVVMAGLGIKVHTIALATPGSDEIDLDLLSDIAVTTGGTAYQASSTAQLAQIFDNITKTIEAPAKLANVVLHQPIPEGFVLAPEGNASNVSYNAAAHEVLVNIGDIPFPFTQDKIDLSINLIPETAAGDYPLQDAKVTFKDACNANQQFNINFDTTLSVSIRVIDKYGNVYLGNSLGEVARLRSSDKERQWTIDEKNSAVSDIKFEDTEHSMVQVSYRDGTKSRWDLKPTAPTGFVMKDANGNVISDTSWHKGSGTINGFSGSANQLPAATVYGNEDFRSLYLAGYQFQIGSSGWYGFNPATGASLPDGWGTMLQAKALTNAISGSSSIPHFSPVASSQVSLDSTGPLVSWKKTSGDPSEDATIVVTASETLSPLTSIRVWFDGNPANALSIDLTNQGKTTYDYTFNLSQVPGFDTPEKRIGWHQIQYEATSVGGVSARTSPDTFVVNPGASGVITPVDYVQGQDIAERPVMVNIVTSHPVVARFDEPEFTVKDRYYLITKDPALSQKPEAPWKKLPATRITVTTETNETQRTYYVFLKLVDDQGVTTITKVPAAIQFDTEQNRN